MPPRDFAFWAKSLRGQWLILRLIINLLIINLYRIQVEIKKGNLMGLQMSQIFPTPQILCLHIIVICLLFIGTQTPQHDWKVIEGLSIGISFHNWKQCWSHISDFLCGPQYPIYEYFTPQEVCIVLKYFLFRCTYFIWSISQASRLLCSSFVGDPVI